MLKIFHNLLFTCSELKKYNYKMNLKHKYIIIRTYDELITYYYYIFYNLQS